MPSSSRSQKKNIRNSSVARITFMGDLSCRKCARRQGADRGDKHEDSARAKRTIRAGRAILQTWDEVVEKFLKKYFPESKTIEGKVEISSFHQHPHESLSEALDRFHGLLWKTPTHGFSKPIQLNIFIDGLQPHSKQLLDATAGGKIKLKTPEEAIKLIENMAANDHVILRDQEPIPQEESTRLEELLLQFMQETRSHQKSTDAAIRNLEVQLAKLVAERPTETFPVNIEMKPKEECKVILTKEDVEEEKKEEIKRNEEKTQQSEKYSQVEIQQESILQVNTSPHQLIIKEERHGKHEKALSIIPSLITNTSLATIWKVYPAYMSFMASLAKRRKCKEDVFYVTFMPP
ncbi:hypothetical protein GmHk_07G019881 [Glycine max]|nr:hypothetical protein GmHk_07G019881 [Glycine max]